MALDGHPELTFRDNFDVIFTPIIFSFSIVHISRRLIGRVQRKRETGGVSLEICTATLLHSRVHATSIVAFQRRVNDLRAHTKCKYLHVRAAVSERGVFAFSGNGPRYTLGIPLWYAYDTFLALRTDIFSRILNKT